MRVVHLVTVPWEATDGVARACLEIAGALDGAEHVLVVDRDAELPPGFAATRAVHGWSPTMPWRRGFRDVLDEFKPDVIHLHGGELVPALAFAPALAGAAVVASCYAPTPSVRGLDRVARHEHRANISTVRAIVTQAGGRTLARRALATGRVAVVCTPDPRVERLFDTHGTVLRVHGGARLTASAARWSDEPVVLFAGRAQSGRGVDDLIAAFGTLHASVPRARLRLLLLQGDSAARWQRNLASSPWADVTVGPVDDLAAEFARAQVGAFPFRWSVTMTPALAAAEAMAAGLPVVATAVDCLSPLVDSGVNGFVVPPADPVALGRALANALAGPDAWQPLAEGARKTIEQHWSWAEAAAITADAYAMAQRRRL